MPTTDPIAELRLLVADNGKFICRVDGMIDGQRAIGQATVTREIRYLVARVDKLEAVAHQSRVVHDLHARGQRISPKTWRALKRVFDQLDKGGDR